MKLALVTDAIYPYHKGGKEKRIYELSRRLAETPGIDVHIYTMKWWDGPETARFENGVWLHAISRRWPLYAGERRSMVQGVMFGLSCWRMLFEKFDVADVDHMPYFPLFSMRAVCWLKRKPMVATWHEVWGFSYWKQYLGKLGVLAGVMEWLTARLPDVIVVVSAQTAADVVSVLKARQPVTLAPNGVDAAAIAKVPMAGEASDLVYVGRLLGHKHVDDLVRAVAVLKRTRPGVRCLIIGDGPERPQLEALARSLGVAKNVIFKGIVESDEDKLALMKASGVFVLPSTREGFSFVTLEALACGLRVVTVDHADNAARHLLTVDTGAVVPAGDVAALAAGIEQMLASRRAVAAAGAVARSYDWAHSAQTLAKVYAQ